jgi:hypothetical protein
VHSSLHYCSAPVALSAEKLLIFERIRDVPEEAMDQSDNEDQGLNYNDFVEGKAPLDISHGGGELEDLQNELNEELNGNKKR